jgi:tyrosinase
VPLTGAASEVGVDVSGPARPEAMAAPETGSRRVYLALENVVGTSLGAGLYAVYVNVPERADPGEFPDRRAGRFSTFGVMESSRSDDVHSGSGLTFSFEITDIVARLAASEDWDPARLRVTITPEGPQDAEPEAMEAEETDAGGVRVGRVSVYYG